MKTSFFRLLLSGMLGCFAIGMQSQSTALKTTPPAAVTPQNVLSSAKELSPRLEQLSAKLAKIKPKKQQEMATKNSILQANNFLAQIIEKGKKLTPAEAAKHDAWFRTTMSKMLQDCLEQNPGSECCFSGQFHGQGWGSMWSAANCFVSNFPDIN